MNVASFGEIIWDIYPHENCIGGAPLNFAAHTVKSGAEAFLISSVGEDALGKRALEELERLHIHPDYVSICPQKSTGQCVVSLDEAGTPTYDVLSDVAYDYISISPKLYSRAFDALAFGTLALRSKKNLAAIKALLEHGSFKKIYCDLNLREPFYNREVILFCLEHANVLKMSDTELETVMTSVFEKKAVSYEQAAQYLASVYSNLELILLTCAEKGAYAYLCREQKMNYTPAVPVKLVSTVGAGDSFGATFLVNYLHGVALCDCMERAARRSAYVVSHAEAVPD